MSEEPSRDSLHPKPGGALLLLVLAVLSLTLGEALGDCLKYQPATVTLGGTVSLRDAFGPPGYGEDAKHDRKEKYLLLSLDTPICVEANTNQDANAIAEAGIASVQMVYVDSEHFKKRWLHKHVWVSGTLFHAVTGHHRTPVLVQVTNVRR